MNSKGEFTRINCKVTDYETKDLVSVPASPASLEVRSFRVWGDNRKRFKEIFGKPCFYYRGEFFYSAWKFYFQGYFFYVLTAATKGTCIEAEKDCPGCLKDSFLETLLAILEEHGD